MSKQLKLRPLGDRVVVLPERGEKESGKTKTGIIIPETVDKEKPEMGKVIAVGPGKWENGKLVPMSVKVGQKVLFSKYGPDEVKVDGVDYYILSESQILAIYG